MELLIQKIYESICAKCVSKEVDDMLPDDLLAMAKRYGLGGI